MWVLANVNCYENRRRIFLRNDFIILRYNDDILSTFIQSIISLDRVSYMHYNAITPSLIR